MTSFLKVGGRLTSLLLTSIPLHVTKVASSDLEVSMWKRFELIRNGQPIRYPATKAGAKQVRVACKNLNKQDKRFEYRWTELIQMDGTFVYVIEWRTA